MDVADRPALDRWVLSRLNVAQAYEGFVAWDYHKACRELEDFVVNDLSNWYVRRSRRRLWDGAQTADKLACQHPPRGADHRVPPRGSRGALHGRRHPPQPHR